MNLSKAADFLLNAVKHLPYLSARVAAMFWAAIARYEMKLVLQRAAA